MAFAKSTVGFDEGYNGGERERRGDRVGLRSVGYASELTWSGRVDLCRNGI